MSNDDILKQPYKEGIDYETLLRLNGIYETTIMLPERKENGSLNYAEMIIFIMNFIIHHDCDGQYEYAVQNKTFQFATSVLSFYFSQGGLTKKQSEKILEIYLSLRESCIKWYAAIRGYMEVKSQNTLPIDRIIIKGTETIQ